MNIASLIFRPDLGFFALTSLQSFKRRPDRAWVRSLSHRAALRADPLASQNDKQERRVSRLRDACIVRLTRPLLRERLFRYGVPTHEEGTCHETERIVYRSS